MRQHRMWASWYRALTGSQWVAGIALAVVGASLKADVAQVQAWVPWAAKPLQLSQAWAWLIIPCLTAYVGVAQLGRKMIGPPWVWDMIHSLLDDLQQHAFKGFPNDPLHYHRATLFRRIPWRWCFRRWPWSGWLAPIERSGHATRHSSVAFLAPDDADRAEGVAGQTWACQAVIRVHDLPDLAVNGRKNAVKQYAKRTWVSEEWLEREQCRARSFCGIHVEIKGKPWGVIILDSRSPQEIPEEVVGYFTQIARTLAKLLERA
jgi:hypothetical protein